MPELPEVETIREGLAPRVEEQTLARVEVLDRRFCIPAAPEEFEAALEGSRVGALSRRGKYLVWELEPAVADRPEPPQPLFLVLHLRMTGNLLLAGANESADAAHLRVRLTLGSGDRVLFTDPRRFGTGVVLRGTEARDAYFAARLGVEPLHPDFTAEALRSLAAGRRAPAKAFLLTQERIAGVGNIYADEALFRAGIHPLRPVGSLRRPQLAALRNAVVASLRAGIDARGATIDDFRHPDGARGSFQDRFLVHRRAGEPCPTCGREIVKLRVAGRGTYVCERCQPRPRIRRAERSPRRARPA